MICLAFFGWSIASPIYEEVLTKRSEFIMAQISTHGESLCICPIQYFFSFGADFLKWYIMLASEVFSSCTLKMLFSRSILYKEIELTIYKERKGIMFGFKLSAQVKGSFEARSSLLLIGHYNGLSLASWRMMKAR